MGFGKGNDLIPVMVVVGLRFGKAEAGDGASNEAAVRVLDSQGAIRGKRNWWDRKCSRALAGVAQWIECWPVNQRVTGSIPSLGTCLGCGAHERQSHVDISLLLFLPPFPSL